jgi:hypothetical protein
MVTGIGQNAGQVLPEKASLSQNYPNPFNPSTNIGYHISKESFVSLRVYDLLGREVAVLVNEVRRPGEYIVKLDARKLSSGVYFYTLRAGSFVQSKKMLLLR